MYKSHLEPTLRLRFRPSRPPGGDDRTVWLTNCEILSPDVWDFLTSLLHLLQLSPSYWLSRFLDLSSFSHWGDSSLHGGAECVSIFSLVSVWANCVQPADAADGSVDGKDRLATMSSSPALFTTSRGQNTSRPGEERWLRRARKMRRRHRVAVTVTPLLQLCLNSDGKKF